MAEQMKCRVCGGVITDEQPYSGDLEGEWHADSADCINALTADVERLRAIEAAARKLVDGAYWRQPLRPDLRYVWLEDVQALDAALGEDTRGKP